MKQYLRAWFTDENDNWFIDERNCNCCVKIADEKKLIGNCVRDL